MPVQEENPDEGVATVPGLSLRALPLKARTGKAAVALAAAHPGGYGHPDDAFVQVGPAQPQARSLLALHRNARSAAG